MIEKTPLSFTIIVAVFNAKTTLQECIDSVVKQTYPNKELIIIDGGSKDGTFELLQSNQNSLAFWVSEPDDGIYHAWNKGLQQATGDWVCFLGADDFFWSSDVLDRLAMQLQALPPAIRVAYGQILHIDSNNEVSQPIGQPWPQIKESFKQYMCIPHVGTMHKKSLFEQHGLFDESFKIAGDYELLLRELKSGDAAFIPDIITVGQRLGGLSNNNLNDFLTLKEVWRAQRLHGQLFPRGFLREELIKRFSEKYVLLFMDINRMFKKNIPSIHRLLKKLFTYIAKLKNYFSHN